MMDINLSEPLIQHHIESREETHDDSVVNEHWNIDMLSHPSGHFPSESEDDVPLISLDGPSENTVQVNWYVKGLTSCPFNILILFGTLGVSVACGAVAFHYHPPPDFDDPTKGFETRGTDIRASASTLNILSNTFGKTIQLIPNASITLESFGFNDTQRAMELLNNLSRVVSKRDLRNVHPALKAQRHTSTGNGGSKRIGTSFNSEMKHVTSRTKHIAFHDLSLATRQYCIMSERSINQHAPKIVMKSFNEEDLLSLHNLHSICSIDDKYIRPKLSNSFCKLHSIAYFIGRYHRKDCSNLTAYDVSDIKSLLTDCAPYFYQNENQFREHYNSGQLNDLTIPKGIPQKCFKDNFVYKVLYYMAPVGYLRPGSNDSKSRIMVESVAYINAPKWNNEHLFNSVFKSSKIQSGHVFVSGLGVSNQQSTKYDIFNDYLIEDIKYFALAASLVLSIMLFYLRSAILVLATIINVLMSFVLAYFIYYIILRFDFFPFINILAGLVLIAVGADDVFIFYDSWVEAKRETGNVPYALELSMNKAFKHAALSVFVTSLTTASAFFANFVSHITAIRCFGIFAGLAILANFFFMVTWTPTVIVLLDIVNAKLWKLCESSLVRCTPRLKKCMSLFSQFRNTLFCKILPLLVGKGWYIWLVGYIAIGIGACVIVFVDPRLKLPRNSDFQLFPSNNVLEAWDLYYKDLVKSSQDDILRLNNKLKIAFVFGFEAKDNGNWLNPDSQGETVVRDKNFNLYSKASQRWIAEFCRELKKQTFVPQFYKTAYCGLELYSKYLNDTCHSVYKPMLGICCDFKDLSMPENQLRKCIPAIDLLYNYNKKRNGIIELGRPLFDEQNTIIGLLIDFQTNLNVSMSYEVMDKYYKNIRHFLNSILASAPLGFDTGFSTGEGDFMFYDLQESISSGTYFSIALSLAVSFSVMLLTSGNILITIYAIVTIAFSIICTVAAIVLLGWELNILESITISLAVGLSIDFTIHYGVAYTISKFSKPSERVNDSFARVGMAVAMAALTTFAAGAAMMPSHILAYTKLGIFLMLVMTFSWLYSTFFFQSICRIIGPRQNFCQLSISCFGKLLSMCKSIPRQNDTIDADENSLISVDSEDSYLVTF